MRDRRAGMHLQRSFAQLYMTDLLQGLIDQGRAVHAVPIRGGWLEVDSTTDLALAEKLSHEAGGRLVIER